MTQQAFLERRQTIRQPVHIATLLRCHRLCRRAVIVDYSLGGLRIDSNLAVAIGERATVELPSGYRLAVQIVWVAGGHIGARFFGAMEDAHPAKLALWEAVREYERLHPPVVTA